MPGPHRLLSAPLLTAIACAAAASAAAATANDPDARAAAVVAQMTPAERTLLTAGILAMPFGDDHTPLPSGAVLGAGFVPGIPRLQVPALTESDASLGVAWALGRRHDGATALPSGLALGSTWNPQLLTRAGAMIAGEAHAKGFNVLLAGGANLVRDPRGGRAFEYLSEDPLHTGLLAGAAVRGIQSQHVISTIKHFALNDQETGRNFMSANIADAAARASDLLAFQIAIEQGQPGAIMCAYNRVNQDYACDSDYLLNKVLKRDWGYRGWVMSDWGAVHGLDSALHGLDQQSGSQIDPAVYFTTLLAQAAAGDARYAARLADMNQRILRSMYAVGIDAHPPARALIDFPQDGAVAEAAALEGLVLLRNQEHALPLTDKVHSIAVIGSYADSGVLAGGGSSLVQGEGGPAIAVPLTNAGRFAQFINQSYHRSVPLESIRARVPGAQVRYRDGRYIAEALEVARTADVVLLFASEWRSEGYDVPDLSLPQGQDELIRAVSAVNPRTIVILETGGPVLMPWLEHSAAVIEAWYPGARGAEALTKLLFGDANFSGKLPVTFPASLGQLPRPQLPGATTVEPSFSSTPDGTEKLDADYDVEGADVGYRWYARRGLQPLFPFGFGLSYTRYEYSQLQASTGSHLGASYAVTNRGARAGMEIAQLYLLAGPDDQGRDATLGRRLLGWAKLELAPGETRTAQIMIDRRLLADYDSAAGGWRIAPGTYTLAAGSSSADLSLKVSVRLAAARFGNEGAR